MNWPQIEAVVYGESDNPREILGPHAAGASTLFQTFIPGAKEVRLRIPGADKSIKMELVDEEGFYALLVSGKTPDEYSYIAEFPDGSVSKIYDPYRYTSSLDAKILKKFATGELENAYNILGAHMMTEGKISGTRFVVWAPNARCVSVSGSFNNWDGRVHQMNHLDSGIFELFIPGVKAGDMYLYDIKTMGGVNKTVIDPYSLMTTKCEDGMKSVVTDETSFDWTDEKFIKERSAEKDPVNTPVIIYECSLEDYKAEKDYASIGKKIAEHAKTYGYTHVEIKPVAEYEDEASCGYETIAYYAPTTRYEGDFSQLVNEIHAKGIKIILDWTLAHPANREYGLRLFDGTACYEHANDVQGIHPQWGTLLFNYGRGEVVSFLKSNALYWIEKYHLDGIRIDSLASILCLDYGRNEGEWIANIYGGHENLEALDFIKNLNNLIKRNYPGVITITEDSSAWPKVTSDVTEGGLGFDYKWNIGWRDDYLRYISKDPLFRAGSHNDLILSMLYCYSDRFVLPMSAECGNLLDIMPGDEEMKEDGIKLSLAYLMTHPGMKLISSAIDSVNTNKDGVSKLVKALNQYYIKHPALYELDDEEDGFEWISSMDAEHSILSFVRKGKRDKDFLTVVVNFAGIEQDINVGVSIPGKYTREFNSDISTYGGSSKVKEDPIYSMDDDVDGRPYYIPVTMPKLSLSIFAYEQFDDNDIEYMLELREEAKKKADTAKEKAKKEEAKAKAAEKKAEEEQKRAEDAAKAAEEAKERAEQAYAKAIEEMEKAREAMEEAREAAKKAEMAAHRLAITEENVKIGK